jgi:hypothetical protein
MRLFGKKNTSKRPRRENGGADVKDVPALSQVGIIVQIHIFSMTEQHLALSPFRYYQPIPIEQGLNGDMSKIITQVNLFCQDPDALVAVTHDSEWITLIETVRPQSSILFRFFTFVQGKLTPEELMQGDRLEEFLSENYSLVSQPENSKYILDQRDHHSFLILLRCRVSSRQKVGNFPPPCLKCSLGCVDSKDVSNSVLIDARRTLSKAGVQQEVWSKPEEFWSTRPSADNFQVVITRMYPHKSVLSEM